LLGFEPVTFVIMMDRLAWTCWMWERCTEREWGPCCVLLCAVCWQVHWLLTCRLCASNVVARTCTLELMTGKNFIYHTASWNVLQNEDL